MTIHVRQEDKTIATLLTLGTEQLKKAGIERPRHEARLLLEQAAGLSRLEMISHPDRDLSPECASAYAALVTRRARDRVPISRLMGQREFWSLSFALTPATLDPRPDSEILVEAVLNFLASQEGGQFHRPLRLLDLGTGSGCLLIALLTELPEATGIGVDFSYEALLTARQNASRHGVVSRTTFVQADWGAGLKGTFDIILSNPPYIPSSEIEGLAPEVRCHDPRAALTAGPEGVEAYRRLAPYSARHLHPDGFCAIEIGQGQGPEVETLFKRAGLHLKTWHSDLSGIQRCGLFCHSADSF